MGVTLEHLAAGAYHDHHVLTVEGHPVVLRRCTGSQRGLPAAAQLAREHATLVALRAASPALDAALERRTRTAAARDAVAFAGAAK